MAAILCLLAGGAWYLSGLPWRNRCGAPASMEDPPARANAAVATSQPLATRAAAEVLKEGGSAVDAAIAAALMLSVVVLQVEPRFDRASLPADLVAKAKKPLFPVGRVQMVAFEGDGWRGISDCRDDGEPWAGTL